MSSRLALDGTGRLVCIVTVGGLSVHVGERFLVVDLFEIGFTRPGGRPTARERNEAQRHAPYQPSLSRFERERQQVPDDELDEAAAVAAAYAEQRRAPADLLNAAV